jgi:hypothetical protein
MELQQYTPKSIAVFGDTKPWRAELKELGGRFNSSLSKGAGWIFQIAKQQEVSDFIAAANSGTLQPRPGYTSQNAQIQTREPHQPAMSPSSALARLQSAHQSKVNVPPVSALPSQPIQLNYPNMFTAADGNLYQVVIYTVPLPKLGQLVTVTVGDQSYDYEVTTIETTSPPYDAIIISTLTDDEESSQSSRAVLINGEWKINGMQDNHTITFQSQN